MALSYEIQRQIGLLVNRKGWIESVIVGDAAQIFLPDIGRLRGGGSRFRGLRLIHTHLKDEPITRDDLTDLIKLRLDLLVSIGINDKGDPAAVHLVHLLPPNPANKNYQTLSFKSIFQVDLDFQGFIKALEDEFSKKESGRKVAGLEGAILVHVPEIFRPPAPEDSLRLTPRLSEKDALLELTELAESAGLQILEAVSYHRAKDNPKYLIGKGKVDELILKSNLLNCNLIVFDRDLKPAQASALTEYTDCRVIDRTQLILDIFAQRAKTRDGKVQVELAQLKYLLPRLIKKNTMMSRLTGGIGARGPGETKLEINRRRVYDRIARFEKEIERLCHIRETKRQERKKNRIPVASLIGYTNAGKSTLLNVLTGSEVFVADKLFATLDPTSRRFRFPQPKENNLPQWSEPPEGELAPDFLPESRNSVREIVITDTVGFIKDLPKDLIRAFKATLEELRDSSLLLHIVDIAEGSFETKIFAVEAILKEIHCEDIPKIMVFNKIDKVRLEEILPMAERYKAVLISARDRETFDQLYQRLKELVGPTKEANLEKEFS